MKTIEINLYKFNELSKEAQQKAIENDWDFNVTGCDWWGSVYEDAENVGIKITGFDIDRGNYCKIKPIRDCEEITESILKEHGEQWEIYKTAQSFLNDKKALVEMYSDGVNKDKVTEDNEPVFDEEMDEKESDFYYALRKCYLSMLKENYEYLTSEEEVKKSLVANDYDFYKDGTVY